ncbi:hypothetical protein [Thalassotalea fusca]
MDSILTKPFAFSIAVITLGCAVAIFMYAEEMYVSGVLLSFASFFIFYSFHESSVQMFKLGRLMIYISAGVLLVTVLVKVPLILSVIFITAMLMFHLNMNQIINEEYLNIEQED